MVGWMDGRKDGYTNGWMDGCVDRWTADWMGGQMDGRVDGWTAGHRVDSRNLVFWLKGGSIAWRLRASPVEPHCLCLIPRDQYTHHGLGGLCNCPVFSTVECE